MLQSLSVHCPQLQSQSQSALVDNCHIPGQQYPERCSGENELWLTKSTTDQDRQAGPGAPEVGTNRVQRYTGQRGQLYEPPALGHRGVCGRQECRQSGPGLDSVCFGLSMLWGWGMADNVLCRCNNVLWISAAPKEDVKMED